MAKMFYEKDTNLGLLQGKKIAVIGFGRFWRNFHPYALCGEKIPT